jgi:6-pyruvoyltetrahydropterin/6-carboxytetrahydropterin synthase
MFELKVVTRFAAAHQLTMVAKQCENLHGHNWKVEVCVSGERLNDAGVLIDFGELKSYIAEIIDELDHRFLNELACFDGAPSSEKIAVYIAEQLQPRLDGTGIRVSRIITWESDNAAAIYTPDGTKTA